MPALLSLILPIMPSVKQPTSHLAKRHIYAVILVTWVECHNEWLFCWVSKFENF